MNDEQYRLLKYKLRLTIERIKAQDEARGNLMEMAQALADDLGLSIDWNKYSLTENKS